MVLTGYYLLYICIWYRIHLLVSATLQMNPISITAVEESFDEMRDKSYLCSVCSMEGPL
jgi:hypothetical protein